MPNEGSYGGYIVVRKNGSVVWQVEPREFPRDRDTDGSLEYAIRVVTSDRNSFSSKDGKCLIAVDPVKSSLNVAGPGTDRAKCLIVSGYETPDTPYDSVVVGKSYFITYGRYVPPRSAANASATSTGQALTIPICDETAWDKKSEDALQIPFTYDLSLRYDDYDLERAGLPAELDPDKLEVCYQNFVSLRDVYRHHFCKRPGLLGEVRTHTDASQRDKEEVLNAFGMSSDSLYSTLVWTKTYRHLKRLGIARDLIDDIETLLVRSEESHDDAPAGTDPKSAPDVVFSRWLSVEKSPAGGVTDRGAAGPAQPSLDPLEITDDDLAATPGKPLIQVEKDPQVVPGSRTITLRGLTQPGTFVLMMHRSGGEHYD